VCPSASAPTAEFGNPKKLAERSKARALFFVAILSAAYRASRRVTQAVSREPCRAAARLCIVHLLFDSARLLPAKTRAKSGLKPSPDGARGSGASIELPLTMVARFLSKLFSATTAARWQYALPVRSGMSAAVPGAARSAAGE
jgi:hypothetical protein